MAKFSPEEIQKLLTAAELKLVQSSQPPALAKLSEAKLKKNITLTRSARDKWRDQSTRQRRDVQRAQGSRDTNAAAHSADKNKILTKALNDLQAQLDKIASGTTAAGTKAPAAKSPGKKKRARGHREARAETRALLEDKRSKLTGASSSTSAKKKVAKKKVAKKKVAKKKVAGQPAVTKGKVTKKKSATKKAIKKTKVKKATTKPSAAKKVSAKKRAAAAAVSSQPSAAKQKAAKKNSLASSQVTSGTNLNPSDQRSTKTKAKKARIQQSGLTTRTRGHISARGKRAQGRRDSRG